MKDIEALKTVNDQIILSIDEPIYLSAEHYISTLSAQLQLDPNEIKDALDFPYLAAKQRKMAAPIIEKYIAEHPYIEGTPYEEYAKELLHAHPGLHVSMIEDFLKGKNEPLASHKNLCMKQTRQTNLWKKRKRMWNQIQKTVNIK